MNCQSATSSNNIYLRAHTRAREYTHINIDTRNYFLKLEGFINPFTVLLVISRETSCTLSHLFLNNFEIFTRFKQLPNDAYI